MDSFWFNRGLVYVIHILADDSRFNLKIANQSTLETGPTVCPRSLVELRRERERDNRDSRLSVSKPDSIDKKCADWMQGARRKILTSIQKLKVSTGHPYGYCVGRCGIRN